MDPIKGAWLCLVDANLSCIENIALGAAGPAWNSCEVDVKGYEIRQFEVGVLNEVRAEGVCAGVY